MKIGKRFEFCAAHFLPNHEGKCQYPHGHNYILEVEIEGMLLNGGSSSGMIMDYTDLTECVKDNVLDRLDHGSLNNVIPNPTTEKIVNWIVVTLQPLLNHASTRLMRITLRESRDTWVTWEAI
jgi:6-pyruvoyltetrahydropterin/6-carboxytetrahydropterin synthase